MDKEFADKINEIQAKLEKDYSQAKGSTRRKELFTAIDKTITFNTQLNKMLKKFVKTHKGE